MSVIDFDDTGARLAKIAVVFQLQRSGPQRGWRRVLRERIHHEEPHEYGNQPKQPGNGRSVHTR
jgi:hypothetical protein